MEQEKLRQVSGGEKNSELEEAQAQVERLQSELKVRMKLNQLQSTKVRPSVTCISTQDVFVFSGYRCKNCRP